MKKMRAYSAFSRTGGQQEGACLVFANSVSQVRVQAWPILQGWSVCDEWVDIGVKWLKDHEHLLEQADKEKLEKNIPHAIECPKTCKNCEMWGGFPNENGTCSICE
jgi:hypothetical protein